MYIGVTPSPAACTVGQGAGQTQHDQVGGVCAQESGIGFTFTRGRYTWGGWGGDTDQLSPLRAQLVNGLDKLNTTKSEVSVLKTG